MKFPNCWSGLRNCFSSNVYDVTVDESDNNKISQSEKSAAIKWAKGDFDRRELSPLPETSNEYPQSPTFRMQDANISANSSSSSCSSPTKSSTDSTGSFNQTISQISDAPSRSSPSRIPRLIRPHGYASPSGKSDEV